MRLFRLGGLLAVTLAVLLVAASSAAALKLCVPERENKPLKTPKAGNLCGTGFKLQELGAEGKEGPAGKDGKDGAPGKEGAEGKEGPAGKDGKDGAPGKEGAEGNEGPEGKQGPEGKEGPEGKDGLTAEQQEALKSILPYITFTVSGVAGKPTIRFSGVNLQLVNGEGKTNSINGAGNLVIGYNEMPFTTPTQTGSHNIVVGLEQTFTSYGGVMDGRGNKLTGPYNIVAGNSNTVSGQWDLASGVLNKESAWGDLVAGLQNSINGEDATVSGGSQNFAGGDFSSIFGGKELKTTNAYEAIP